MKNICYDPKLDSEIFTTEQAAEYLGYTYKYMRQVLCEGKLKSYDNAGMTRLFLKSDLDVYLRKRDGIQQKPQDVSSASQKIVATVHVPGVLMEDRYQIKDFDWDELPKLHGRLKAGYGKDIDFRVELRTPAGGTWNVRYYAPNIVDKAIDMVKGKFKRK